MVNAIRGNDPDAHPNVVVLGTPNWDQDVGTAAASPLTGSNLMYAVHFYSGTHNSRTQERPTVTHASASPRFFREILGNFALPGLEVSITTPAPKRR